jgi:peptidoglycan/xylan/chitin deacetylase (PgdA/CDA1 family)
MMLDRRRFLAASLGTAAAVALGGCGGRDAAKSSVDGSSSTSTGGATTAASSTPTTATTVRPGTTAAPTTARAPGAPARFVTRGNSTNSVALTFHTNGDLALAQRLLDAVAGRAAITCFIVGDWLDANPTWARKLLDAGHELANHTYTHPTFESLSRANMATEITKCRDVLVRLTGKPGTYFRPSGTDDGLAIPSAAVLEEAGKAGYDVVLGWDTEPFDYQDPGRAAVQSRVLDTIKPGSIVSLHFGHTGTVEALPAILDGLSARGLKAVTASKLLGG